MTGRGGGGSSLCIMLGSAPSGPSFLVSLLVGLAGVDCDGVGKGGPRVLTPDLVILAKVSTSGFGVLLFLIVERIWENCIVVLIELQKGRIIVDVSPGQAYLLDRVVLSALFDLVGSSAVVKNKVLETNLGAFDGFVGPLFEYEDQVSKGRGFERGWLFGSGVVGRGHFIIKEISSSYGQRLILMLTPDGSPKPSEFSSGFVKGF
ncbi:hypothetical protein Tco_0869460 [Tanacetum coccineum]